MTSSYPTRTYKSHTDVRDNSYYKLTLPQHVQTPFPAEILTDNFDAGVPTAKVAFSRIRL